MAEADQNALVIRRKVTRSAGNPAHDAAVAREYRDRCANRITIAPSPLKFKSNPVIALSDVVSQEHRGAVEGCEHDVGIAVIVEIPNCKSARDVRGPECGARSLAQVLKRSPPVVP